MNENWEYFFQIMEKKQQNDRRSSYAIHTKTYCNMKLKEQNWKI